MYIDDCTQGIDRIMHCEELIATPINLGSSELISINELVSMVEEIGGVKLRRTYDLDAPKGVGRPQQRQHHDPADPALGAEHAACATGWQKTYAWIEQQYRDRKAGKRTVRDVA